MISVYFLSVGSASSYIHEIMTFYFPDVRSGPTRHLRTDIAKPKGDLVSTSLHFHSSPRGEIASVGSEHTIAWLPADVCNVLPYSTPLLTPPNPTPPWTTLLCTSDSDLIVCHLCRTDKLSEQHTTILITSTEIHQPGCAIGMAHNR